MTSVAVGHAQLQPALGGVDGALELFGVHEGLDHQDGMAVAGLPVRAEAVEGETQDPRTQIGLVCLGQDEETAVVGHQTQAAVTLATGPADPPLAVLEVFCCGAEDQDCQPAAGGIDRGVEHPFADGLHPAEVVMFSEKALEAALIGRIYQGDDPDIIQRDRTIFAARFSMLHAPKPKKSGGSCPAQSA